ncbi:hypothetical protein LOTGIDRAFT_134818 [Lottia gigantea]|uniref:tRNA-dihydrouridine synthase n=1 Tax=Lottia gigantea TaxID=225164 RepID=V3ZE30_LOTGI|nr:hypothetical protein LOTGIDRAFT_134818 [Lottia gigantea]ESO82322.1 hypothetical protein LOTGIDRAFT_134818 [Lottia gigantea]
MEIVTTDSVSIVETPTWKRPLELLNSGETVKICAPMVRYSKLAFRMLVRQYDCDLAFTPMIVSDSFIKSVRARDSDFSTCKGDRPLIVQFAANNSTDLATAAEIVYPFSDGIDLNCGCPQKWAMADGYGSSLIYKSELLCDMIKQTRNRVPDTDFTVSIKIRIHPDIRQTVDLCQKAEQCGVSFISVHGRTKDERTNPVNIEAIRSINDSVGIPVIANGDIKTLQDVKHVVTETGVNGVMAARGILTNPTMYTGSDVTSIQCIKQWCDLALDLGTPFPIFHHHLIYMMEKLLCRSERRIFNSLVSTTGVLEFLKDNYNIS